MKASEGADRVLGTCAGVTTGERVFVLKDRDGDDELAAELAGAAVRRGATAEVRVVEPADLSADADLSALPAELLAADVLIAVTTTSVYHSTLGRTCAERGGRVLALTGCGLDTLMTGAIEADFADCGATATALSGRLGEARLLRLTTASGTDLSASLEGRPGCSCTGSARTGGQRTGFPDVEAFIAPIEESVTGRLVVDVTTTTLGLLRAPLTFEIADGIVTGFDGPQADDLREHFARFGPRPLQVAEFGFGLNPTARLIGRIIEDEGRLGTGHVALGNNIGFGGKSVAPFHEDLVYWHPTLELDGELVIERGVHRWLE